MELSNISSSNKDIVIKSIIWNTIIEFFHKEKSIDITPYLDSIKIYKYKITIKTTKPIMRTELEIFDETIQKEIREKLKNLSGGTKEYQITYL